MTPEKDYMAIAKRKITRPSQVKSYRRILVYAKNKKGKSRFGISAGVERTLVIDPEHGTDTMKHLNPYVWHAAKWEDVNEVCNFLKLGPVSPKDLGIGPEEEPFQWVCVDGMTRINNMALRYIMRVAEERDLERRPGIIDRRDYNKSGELMKEMILKFHSLPMNVVYTAQERFFTPEETEEGEASSYYVPDIPQGVRGALNSIVEVIGRLYSTKVTVKDKENGGTKEVVQRRLWLGLHPNYDTGYRSDFVLPDYVKNPTLDKLVNLMLTGEEKGN